MKNVTKALKFLCITLFIDLAVVIVLAAIGKIHQIAGFSFGAGIVFVFSLVWIFSINRIRKVNIITFIKSYILIFIGKFIFFITFPTELCIYFVVIDFVY